MNAIKRSVPVDGFVLGMALVCLGPGFPVFADASNDGGADDYRLGQGFEHGEGVDQDFSLAFVHYCRAAEKGHRDAAYNLGWMYLNGRGQERSDVRAGGWFQRAALAGDPDAARLITRLGLTASEDDPACPVTLARYAPPRGQVAESAAEGDRKTVERAGVDACTGVGPLASRTDRARLREWAGGRGLISAEYVRAVPYGRIYQVYLEPLGAVDKARLKARDLSRRGVRDAVPIHTGVLKTGLSLGAYRREEDARARVESLRAYGVTALYRTQNPIHRQRWVRMTLPEAARSELARDFPSLRMEAAEGCPEE
ncbi:MAG: tetratricopeptide repeat protein [Gammaproteobacteria bacterium]